MIKIIDRQGIIDGLFVDGIFCLDKWISYINSIYENSEDIFLDDFRRMTDTGQYSFEKDFLPILNNVYKNPKLEVLHKSFEYVTKDLNKKIMEKFGRELNLELVLYLGLCNGAGWVTEINDKDVILLGIEKIIELEWYDIDSMYGLIYHELGHMYHKQFGKFIQESSDRKKGFVWQLFTEGIAMYFEQTLLLDHNYYHQDKNGWKTWCDNHFKEALSDFNKDLSHMDYANQRYFGDWVSYRGKGDVGYYLGTRFIQYLSEEDRFDEIINFDIEEAYKKYQEFILSIL